MKALRKIQNLLRRLRRLTGKKLARRILLLFTSDVEERICRMTPSEALELPETTGFGRDRWEDLLLFSPTEPGYDRDACLREWRSRLDRGEHVYTRVQDGRLIASGWMIERQKVSCMDDVQQSYELPDESAVVYDFYILPEYRHLDVYQLMLIHALRDAAQIPWTRWIYVAVRAGDKVPEWWIQRLGVEHCESLYFRRRLWYRKTWRHRIEQHG